MRATSRAVLALTFVVVPALGRALAGFFEEGLSSSASIEVSGCEAGADAGAAAAAVAGCAVTGFVADVETGEEVATG